MLKFSQNCERQFQCLSGYDRPKMCNTSCGRLDRVAHVSASRNWPLALKRENFWEKKNEIKKEIERKWKWMDPRSRRRGLQCRFGGIFTRLQGWTISGRPIFSLTRKMFAPIYWFIVISVYFFRISFVCYLQPKSDFHGT